jgi:hypothetical protein
MARSTSGVSEVDLVVPTLRLAAKKPGGKIKTSDLIQELTGLFNPTGKDAQIAKNRSDTYFSQKVRNLVSHKQGPSNVIGMGYADHFTVPGNRRGGGIILTEEGRRFLKKLGY